jgi:hypothetical protein
LQYSLKLGIMIPPALHLFYGQGCWAFLHVFIGHL